MATQDRVLKRAYQISLPGAAKATEQIGKLDAAFAKLHKTKLELNGQLNTAISGKDASAVEDLRKQIAGLEAQMKTLTKQRADAGKEALNQARAEQALAGAKAAEARAAAEQARAERERTTTAIAQEKELDRLIAQEEKQAAALEKQRQKAIATSGSYKALYQDYRELYALVQNTKTGNAVDFRGQTLGFDEAIAKLKQLAAAEQDFRRQFSRDGLLVGEYTSGIVQAFKQAGLGDLVAGQLTKGQQELDKLNREFEQTRQELSQIRVTGQGSFETLERSLIENRTRATELERELGNVRREFRGVGDIGDQITTSLGNGFKSLKRDLAQFVLSYVGFQALLTTTQAVFRDTVKLDSQASALQFVSGSTEELARNQQFLSEVTDRLGLRILDSTQSFKSFYAASTQAGIGAEETRTIFEAAASASANLKLSQEDTNGVLLAFGQIASKGNVQAEELRGQIGERLPGAFAIAARALGVTQQELDGMLKKGEVVASDFLPKFARELQATFGGDSTARVEGLQASINRLRNQFTLMVAENQEGLSRFISGFIQAGGVLLSIIGTLTGNLPVVIGLLSAYALGWAVVNRQLVITNTLEALQNARIIVKTAALGVLTALTYAHSVALAVFTGATSLASGAVAVFNNVLRVTPLGGILLLLGVVAAAMKAFGGAVTGTTAVLRAQSLEMQANADVTRKAAQATAEETAQLRANVRIASDLANSNKTRLAAINALIAKYPEFSRALRGEEIDVRALAEAYQEVANKIRIAARAKAAATLTEDKLKAVSGVEGLLSRFETETGIQNPRGNGRQNVTVSGLSKEDKALLLGGFFGNDLTNNSSIRDAGSDRITFLAEDLAKVRVFLNKNAEEKTKVYQAYAKASEQADSVLQNSQTKSVKGAENVGEALDRLDAELKKKREDRRKILQDDTAALRKNEAEQDAIQKQIDNLNGKDGPKAKAYGGARLTGEQKDAQREADAVRDAAVSKETERYEKLKQERALDVADEIEHLKKLQEAEEAGFAKRLSSLSGKNAAEKKIIEDVNLKKVDVARKTAQAIYEVEDDFAKQALEQAKRNADNELAIVQNSDADPVTRARAQVNYLQQVEAATKTYYDALTTAASSNKDQIARIEAQKAEALRSINRDLLKDVRELQRARFEYEISQLEKVANLQDKILRTQAAQRRIAILSDKNLRPVQQQRSLDKLEGENRLAAIDNQIDLNNQEIEAYKRKYGMLAAFNQEYTELVTANAELAAARQQQLNENETRSTTGMWNIKKETLETYLIRRLDLDSEELAALKQGAQIGQEMLQNYFAGEQERIDQKRSASLERLDLEKQELLNTAQSNNERAAIEKQYEAKKKQVERDAAKERKTLALQQLEIETALGIAKTLASVAFPFNIALAAAQGLLFLQQKQRIQAQKFEKGGMPEHGGEIGGKRHHQGGTPFRYGGNNYEAEVGELAIISRNAAASAQRMIVSGTPRQIASAINAAGGGISFAPGASINKYEYGGALQAPNFTPRSYGSVSGNSSSDLAPLVEMITAQSYAIAETAQQVRQIQVVQVTSTVTNAQQKEVRNQSVATI